VDVIGQAQRSLEWLQGLSPRLRRVAMGLRIIAGIGVGAAVVIFLLLVAEYWPPSLGLLLGVGLVAALLAAAPAMLWIFAGGLAAVADLPDAIAASPELFRRYTDELARLYEDVVRPQASRVRSVGSGLFGGLRVSWRVWREFPDVGAIRGVGRVSLVLFALLGLFMTGFNLALVPAVAAFDLVHS
jgi:hypothetical protein